MKTFSRVSAFAIWVLVLVMSACVPQATGISSPETKPAPTAAGSTQTPVKPTDKPGNAAQTTLTCDQLIPPDEAKSLMTGLSPKLSAQTGSGETTCTWQYTSKSTGQMAEFRLQAGTGASAVEQWTTARKSELSGQPSDLVVNSMDVLRDESYVWTSKPDNLFVVYVRRGAQTLILHYQARDILYMGTESGVIDMADRIFNRMNR